jgi:hypothetical protein
MDELTIDSELQLVQAAINWAKVQNRGVELDPQSSKKLLGPCLEQLRMLNLTPTEFSKYVANSGLFSSDDTLKILINLTTPGAMEMPQGVSTITKHRKAFGAAAVTQREKINMVVAVRKAYREYLNSKQVEKVQILCVRGAQPRTQKVSRVVQSPTQFKVVEFKTSKNVSLASIRFAAQTIGNKKNEKGASYLETILVAIHPVNDLNKVVAFQTHIAPVEYSPGFFDVKFTNPGALVAGQLYVLEVNIKSQGVYMCKTRSNAEQFEDYEFTFSADSKRFPNSGILMGLVLEHMLHKP